MNEKCHRNIQFPPSDKSIQIVDDAVVTGGHRCTLSGIETGCDHDC
jgi:hypothetical protein